MAFSKTKDFLAVNNNDKYFVNLDELNNKDNFPNEINQFACLKSLRVKIILYINGNVEYFAQLKELICELQHLCGNKLFPNIFSIETLNDAEFETLIDRLRLSNKTIFIYNK